MPDFVIELGSSDGIARVVESVTIADPVATIFAKRGTKPPYRVRFSRKGVAELLPGGSLLRYTAKTKGKYDGNAIVSAWDGDWTTPGDASGWYTATVNYDTDPLNVLMLSPDANPDNDVPTLVLMGAFSWGPAGVDPTETDEFAVQIKNLINNTASSAATPTGIHPSPLATLDYLGGGATKLDGIITVGLTVPCLVVFLHATEGLQHYVLVAGTDAESSPDVIHPDDYDAGTNAVVWKPAL